jgi:hypothetical protein
MDSPQFNVIVDGNLLDGFEAGAVLQQLQQKLKLPETKAQLLIAGKNVTVKRAVEEAIANAYCQRLRSLGVNARVETNTASTSATVSSALTKSIAATPISRQIKRYFSDTALGANETNNSSSFKRAVTRAGLAVSAIIFAYGLLALFSVGLFLFYLISHAYLLVAPPILFSATVYFIVSIALAAVSILLLRPLLPQQQKIDMETVLSPVQEPALFDFIAQLCDKLAVKRPEEITLNATAANTTSLLSGFKNFLHGDYRLTLSLPTLENSSLNQFAGILAADLATQAKLPLLRYGSITETARRQLDTCLINRDWLALHTEKLGRKLPSKLMRAYDIARKIIEQSDRYLQKISDRMISIDTKLQRPLLQEQDRYHALIAGSKNFADLMIFRARLAAAIGDANEKNLEDRVEGGLVDDLPGLIKHYYDGAEENFAVTTQRKWDAETTPRRNAPPIARERIEYVANLAKTGMIDDAQPALSLLQYRDELARKTTLNTYRNAGVRFDAANLIPVDELTYAATQDILQRQQAAIYFNDWFRPFRFWSLADYKLISDMPLQDAAAQLSVCVNEIRRLTPDRAKLLSEYERLHNQLREILLAQHVLAAGKKYSFRYLRYDGTTLAPVLDERQKDIASIVEKLSQQEIVMGGRITLGLRLSGQAEREVHELHDALRLLHDIGARLYKLTLDCYQLEQLLQRHYELHEADYSLPIKKLEIKINDACMLLIVRLGDIPYPLDSRHLSLKSFVEVILSQPIDEKLSPILQRAKRLIDILHRVNEKLSRQAADYGAIAEEAYRIEPIKLVGNE